MSTIPASQIVQVIPSVLSAGGRALDIIGVLLTTSSRVPIGAVQPFSTAQDVADYFGDNSTEAALATIYFNGFNNANTIPSKVYFTQYPTESVPAYLRGGSIAGLTLAQIKAIPVGTIVVPIDGANITAAHVDLSAATSPSNAAAIIQAAFNEIQATATSNTISGTTLTLGGTITGTWAAGQMVTGLSVTSGTYITAFLAGTPNTSGATYTLSASSTVSVGEAMTGGVVPQVTYDSTLGELVFTTILDGANQTISYALTSVAVATFTGSGSSTNLTASAVTGYIAIGSAVTGTGVPPATTIASQTSGVPGGAGVYVTNNATTSSGDALTATPPASISTNLKLTEATGAVLSQGAIAATPIAFMNGIIDETTDWATFMLCFDPDVDPSTPTNKLLFAEWASDQANRYAFICWDTDDSPATTVPATDSLGYLIDQNGYSGTCVIGGDGSNTVTASYAAFVCGAAAAIDFTEHNGRITFAFRYQSGLLPTCTNASASNNLISNGYNFIGAYATANDQFVFLYPGSVSGDFKWLDSFINQIWLNNQFQLALMVLLTTVKSIPYNQVGYTMIRAACLDVINAGLNFGAFRPGVTLSQAQAAEVNSDAGITISTTLNQTGWYLQVLDASPQVRAARKSPPCTFFYMDGQAVQQINLASVDIQ